MNASNFEQMKKSENKSKNVVRLFCINCPFETSMKRTPHREALLCPHCGNFLVIDE